MSRYIDAEWLKIALEFYRVVDLSEAPSIDIVFCKECRYFDGFDCNRFGEPAEYNSPCSDDGNDFCSFGERREP